MSARSRTKGASAERDVAQKLFAELGIGFSRVLDQYRDAGLGDLEPDDPQFPFCIEVKRRATANTCEPAWEAQAWKAAERANKHAAVIYRGDNRPWRVRVYADAVAEAFGSDCVCGVWLETDLQGFAWIAREIMADRARRRKDYAND